MVEWEGNAEVIPPMVLDPGLQAVYSGDGCMLRKRTRVFCLSESQDLWWGAVRKIDFNTRFVVVGFGTALRPHNAAFPFFSHTIGNGISFNACSGLGADVDRLYL